MSASDKEDKKMKGEELEAEPPVDWEAMLKCMYDSGDTPALHCALELAAQHGNLATSPMLRICFTDACRTRPLDHVLLLLRYMERLPDFATQRVRYATAAGNVGRWDVAHVVLGGPGALDANATSDDAILFAGQHGLTELAMAVIGSRASVDVTDSSGRSPLMFAAERGDDVMVELLLGNGVGVRHIARDGWTAATLAESGDYSELAALLSRLAPPTEEECATALLRAFAHDNRPLIDLLLRIVRTPSDVRADRCWRVLKLTCGNGGGDNNEELAAVGLVMGDGDNGGVDEGDGDEAANDDDDAAPNAVRALIVACKQGRIDVVTVLFRFCQPDVGLPDYGGETALMAACEHGDVELLQLLLPQSDVNATTESGRTALMEAALHGSDEAVHALLIAEAEVDAADSDGRTALAHARTPATAQLLVDAGASLDAAADSITPLMCASMRGDVGVVEFLLGVGADVNALSVNGWTAREFADAGGFERVVDLLRDRGGLARELEANRAPECFWSKGDAVFKLVITGQRFQISVYGVDWSQQNRRQDVRLVLGDDDSFASAAQAVRMSGPSFVGGSWTVWDCAVPNCYRDGCPVALHVRNLNEATNWVLSAVMVDASPGVVPDPQPGAETWRTPTPIHLDPGILRGRWHGVYGSCGGVLLGGPTDRFVPPRPGMPQGSPALVSLDIGTAERGSKNWGQTGPTASDHILDPVPAEGDETCFVEGDALRKMGYPFVDKFVGEAEGADGVDAA